MKDTENTAPGLPATKLSPPWVELVEKLRALFGRDPDIKIDYDDGQKAVSLFVKGQEKAYALAKLLPVDVAFGNVSLRILVIPANEAQAVRQIVGAAFAGNPAIESVETVPSPLGEPVTFAVFAREPVDVPCDNMADPNGNRTMLLADLARDILGTRSGCFFCTAPAE